MLLRKGLFKGGADLIYAVEIYSLKGISVMILHSIITLIKLHELQPLKSALVVYNNKTLLKQ